MTIKQRIYHFLINGHQFQKTTLDMLNKGNLEQLAEDYGFKK